MYEKRLVHFAAAVKSRALRTSRHQPRRYYHPHEKSRVSRSWFIPINQTSVTYRYAVAYTHFTAATWITKSRAHTKRSRRRRRRRRRRDVATTGVVVVNRKAILNVWSNGASSFPKPRTLLMPHQRKDRKSGAGACSLRCGLMFAVRLRREVTPTPGPTRRPRAHWHRRCSEAASSSSSSTSSRAIPTLSLSHSTRTVLLHPPAPTASPALTPVSSCHPLFPLPFSISFRPNGSHRPSAISALPGTRHQVLYIYYITPFLLLAPYHVDLCNTLLLSSLYLFLHLYSVGLRISSRSPFLDPIWELPTSPCTRFSHSLSLLAYVIKFCLRAFVSQLPLSGLSKFILTLLYSFLALSYHGPLLHSSFFLSVSASIVSSRHLAIFLLFYHS